MLKTFLMLAFGVALIAWGAASFAKLSSSSNRGDIVGQLAAPVLDRVEALTDRIPGSAEDGTLTMRIVATGGSGVAIRSDCADDARAGGALVEGTLVTVAARGEAACFGWTLVSLALTEGAAPPEDAAPPDDAAPQDDTAPPEDTATPQTWVRDAYLEVVLDTPAGAAAGGRSE